MAESVEPRRSTRKAKPVQRDPIPESVPTKRKAKADADPAEQLRFMLQNPKSRLTKMDISDLINANSWDLLSSDSQSRLAALLPPTAFPSFKPTLGSDHPATGDSMQVDSRESDASVVDPSLFTDAHFLAAARTFQDHLFSNWLSDTHAEKVEKYTKGIQDGSLAAPWKDEVWERDNPPLEEQAAASQHLAGEASELRLGDLAKNSVLREGDVLVYRRNFANVNILVEKDVIIQRIDSRSHSLTVLAQPGIQRDLPADLLMPGPPEPSPPTRIMTITSPTQLETGLLDIDGRVDKAKRPNGNAWKALTVWRWSGDDLGMLEGQRGGREAQGTLFYLRACLYQDL